MKLHIKKTRSIIGIAGCLLLFSSCEKLIEIKNPNNSYSKESVYGDNKTAIGVLNSIMAGISEKPIGAYGLSSVPVLTGLSADEITLPNPYLNPTFLVYYQNNLTATTISGNNIWKDAYKQIYKINDAIEGITGSNNLVPAVKKQLIGEAKFFRAFYYFYLTNLYGNVPLIEGTDFQKNSTKNNSAQSDVYRFIISDLKEAKDSLSLEFLDGTLLATTAERVRPTKWAASALLARVYLYTQNWTMAEEEATIVIEHPLFQLSALDEVFLKNSNEAILQCQPISGSNTIYAQYYFFPDGSEPNFYHPVCLSQNLLNSFEEEDNRKNKWTGKSVTNTNQYWYPFKYRHYETLTSNDPLTEYYMIIRLGELYLIRAEARAQQEKNQLALQDLDAIRNRAGLDDSGASSNPEILQAILHERQVELFAEWGDRWFDLRRTNKLNEVMPVITTEKGGNWESFCQYFPIYIQELLYNPNLKQTPGYN